MALQLPAAFTATHVQQVHRLLTVASQPDAPGAEGRRKAADDAVQQCLFIPGFMAVLQTVFCDRRVDKQVRFVALSCAKNTIRRHWAQRPRRALFQRRGAGGRGGAGAGAGAGRAAAPPPVSDAEKASLKATILAPAVAEMDDLIARHMALLASLMVRVEVRGLVASNGRPRLVAKGMPPQQPQQQPPPPPFWPGFFATLIAGLRGGAAPAPAADPAGAAAVLNSARVLYHALDEFSSMKIQVHQALFRREAAAVLPPTLAAFQRWAAHVGATLQAVQGLGAGTQARDVAERVGGVRYVLKLAGLAALALQRLIVRGCPNLASDSPSVHAYFSFVVPLFKQLNAAVLFLEALCARREFAQLDDVRSGVAELLATCVQTVTEAHKQATRAFVPFLAPFLQLFTGICMGQTDASDGAGAGSRAGGSVAAAASGVGGGGGGSVRTCTQLHIAAVLFVAEVFDLRLYHKTPEECDAAGDAVQQRAAATVRAAFTPEFQTQLLQVAVLRLMKLTAVDLEEWAEDGEAFVQAQADMKHSECLRSASEHLVLAVADRSPAAIQAVMAQLVKGSAAWQLPAAVPGKPSEMCLTLDALLAAFGVCFYQLKGAVEFAPWLASVGLRYLNVPAAAAAAPLDQRIVQRRVLWLVKCCLYPLEGGAHARLYQPLLLALQSADRVVCVEATATLQAMVEDATKFQLRAFAPHARAVVHALVHNVFAKCSELATGEAALELLRNLIDRLGPDAKHVAGEVLGPLPALWKKCEDMNVLRPKVMQIADALVDNLDGAGALAVVGKVLPLVKYALNVRQAEFHILAGPGMSLWRSMMQASPVYDKFFHGLFPCVRLALQFSLEHVFLAMSLVKSYVLLGGAAFLKVYAGEVAAIVSMVQEESRDGDVDACVTWCLDVLATCFPAECCTFLHAPLAAMLRSVCEGTGRLHVRLGHMSVLARLLACAPGAFFRILERLAATASPVRQGGADPKTVAQGLFLKLVDLWLDHADCIGHNVHSPLRQRVWALALCRALSANHPGILQRVPTLLNAVASTLMDTRAHAVTAADLGRYLMDRVPSSSSSAARRGRGGGGGGGGGSSAVATGKTTTSPEGKRWQAALARDYVNTTDLAAAVHAAVAQCKSALGAAQVNAAVARAEASTLAILRGQAPPAAQ